MAKTINQILGGIPMTAAAQTIKRGLPELMPPQFMRVTRQVVGNAVQYKRVDGGRDFARLVHYGSPSILIGRKGITEVTTVMAHSFEHMAHNPLILQNLSNQNDDSLQQLAIDEIDRQTADFMARYNNLRLGMVYSLMANGKIWFDAEGNLLFSSSGAAVTVDYAIPAGNLGQLNVFGAGAIIGASWATTSTDIISHLVQLKKAAIKKSGYPIVHAFYGENIPGYVSKNDFAKVWMQNNPQTAQQFLDTGEVPNGFVGIQWHPIYQAFGLNGSGTETDFFGADSIFFCSEPSPEWYEFVEGSYMVPRRIDVSDNARSAIGNLATVFGKFSYALPSHDPVSIKHYAGDTCLPLLKVPGSVFIADVTP